MDLISNNEIQITLKEITDLLNVRHDRAMQKVEELTKEDSFGTVSKTDIVYNNKNQTIPTCRLNKKQAIAVGAKLNNNLLMKLIDRLEALESNKPKLSELDLIIGTANEIKKTQLVQQQQQKDIDYLKNTSPISYDKLKILEDKRKSKTRDLVGYNPDCDKSKTDYSRTIRALTKAFKNRFSIARYADMPKNKYQEALEWLNNATIGDIL